MMVTQNYQLSLCFRKAFIPEYIAKEVRFCTNKWGYGHRDSKRRYSGNYLTHYQLTRNSLRLTSESRNSRQYSVEEVIIFSWGAVRSYCASLATSQEDALIYRVGLEIPLILWVTPPEQQEAVLRYLSDAITNLLPNPWEIPTPIFDNHEYQRVWLATKCMLYRGWPWLYVASEWINDLREDPLVAAFL